MGGTLLYTGQARIQDFLKGGGVKTFTSTPPPPLDIARVTSSTFQGGRVIGPSHAHFASRFSVSGQVQGGWGGGDHPSPPPDPPLQGMVGLSIAPIMAETRSLAPIAGMVNKS